MLKFATYKGYPYGLKLMSNVGNWPDIAHGIIDLPPGNWHIMVQGVETSEKIIVSVGEAVVQFDPQSESPLMLPVQYLKVTISEETPLKLVISSVATYTLYLTQLWDL